MRKYDVILADPPWWYANRLTGGGRTKFGSGAQGHYKTLKAHEIIDPTITLDIELVKAENCVLFMWTTFPLLYDEKRRRPGWKPTEQWKAPNDAFTVMDGWNFGYSTGAAWGKKTKNGSWIAGPGHYFGSTVELLLVGTQGKGMRPVDWGGKCLIPNLFESVRGAHSEKPQEVHQAIDLMYPGARKLELFARRPYEGWDVFGNEVKGSIELKGTYVMVEKEKAEQAARAFINQYGGHAVKMEVAGSVRRGNKQVKDVEIVCHPKWERNLFGEEKPYEGNKVLAAMNKNKVKFLKGNKPDAKYVQFIYADITFDLFFAHEQNYAMQLLIRTGSWEFSKAIMAIFNKRGYTMKNAQPHKIKEYVNEEAVPGTPLNVRLESEGAIFQYLGLPFIPPEKRHPNSEEYKNLLKAE